MSPVAFVAMGLASWFSRASSGTTMANGQPLNDAAHVCATRHLVPFGTRLELVNSENGRESWCIVSDVGPAESTGRIIDVSLAVARDLDMVDAGVVTVRIYRRIAPPHARRACTIQCDLAPSESALSSFCRPLCP